MPVLKRGHPGWTLPGYRYLGPFNDLDQGEPTNPLDAAARIHDQRYTDLINRQLYPYLFFNQADEELIQEAKKQPGLAAYLTNFVFSTKKKFFPHQLGTKRKGVFINKALQAKKAKLQSSNQSKQTHNNQNQPSTNTMAESEPMEEGNLAPGGGGGGGRGGGGVGFSTGNYDNRTQFYYQGEYCYVTSHCTRHVYVNQSLEDNYILIETQTANGTDPILTQHDNYHAQIQTPWYHLDPNCWGVWFCPSDFQKIITEAAEIEIESYEWKIFNISIKTATTLESGQTVYNNDLVATLQVALDENGMMPYTPEAPRNSTIGFIPWHPTTLPIYRYYIETENTIRWDNHAPYEQQALATRQQSIDVNYQFFVIEQKVEIDLLRTGDELTSGIYKFHCKPYKNLQLWQSSRTLGKPPIVEKQASPQQKSPYDPTIQRGSHWGVMRQYQTQSPNESDQVRPYDIGYQVPFWNFAASYGGPQARIAPPSYIPPQAGDRDAEMSDFVVIYDYQHGNYNPEHIDAVYINQYGVVGQGQGNPGSWIQTDLTPNQGPAQDGNLRTVPLFPTNMTNTYHPYVGFNNYDITYPQGQIWDKKLHTEHQPEFSASAPFICQDTPPGQIFIKVTPQYTENVNPNAGANPKIDTYANFFWTGKLKLKYKVRQNRQYNTYFLPKLQDNQQWAGKPTAEGFIRIPNLQGRVIKDIYY